MTQKRQFRGTSKPRTFFDRKIHIIGMGRGLSITKVIPKDWQYVRLQVVHTTEKTITIRITKLLGETELAQTQNTNTGSEQHT